MNQLLKNQLEKHLGQYDGDLPEGFDALLKAISETYDHYTRIFNSPECTLSTAGYGTVLDKNTGRVSGRDHEELLHISLLLESETQRRQLAELQYHNREAHLKASQCIARVGSWEVYFEAGKLVDAGHYWSDETYRILGYTRGQSPALGMFFSRLHPEDTATVHHALALAVSRGGPYLAEHRLLMPDGSEKLVCGRARIFFNEDGAPCRMIGTIQDITGMKAYEAQLEKAGRELRMLFDSMQEVFFSVDMEHYRLIQMSPASERVYGYTVADFEANLDLWRDVILEEDMHVIEQHGAIMRTGQPIVNEYRIRHKNGSIRWLETRIKPMMNNDGGLVRIDGITSDITLRKEMEAALRDSEYKFRSLIQNSSDAITVINKDMEIVFASDSVARIIGIDKNDVIGASSHFFTHPGDRGRMEQFMKELLENPGERRRTTYRILKKDGSFVWCDRVSVNLLHEPAVQGIVSNFRDITEQKMYEDALQASNEELKKSNTELDKFVYSASHDLRAPLSSMIGIINMMEPEDGAQIAYINLLRNSISKLDGFISDILDYSRNARTAIEPQEIDFEELVADVTGNLKFMDTAQPVQVQVGREGDLPMFSDRGRMAIILNNLVSNAIRYHDPARVASEVHIRLVTGATTCTIEVADNGIGIDATEQEKVFDMFYRVSKKSIGSGLGLYIVKETVEKLGGTISLSSQPGVGTTFRISVPNLI